MNIKHCIKTFFTGLVLSNLLIIVVLALYRGDTSINWPKFIEEYIKWAGGATIATLIFTLSFIRDNYVDKKSLQSILEGTEHSIRQINFPVIQITAITSLITEKRGFQYDRAEYELVEALNKFISQLSSVRDQLIQQCISKAVRLPSICARLSSFLTTLTAAVESKDLTKIGSFQDEFKLLLTELSLSCRGVNNEH